ncbi:MAG: aminotransferase class III-fold pyridoxal phosphate-dependent enzyme [Deltaproteobacteria bacterium]|nr:MAG: aminotransferase class III-fold pyridoxal phosphate-dependent enzyme [Deltaproteobacteria bacterium]
MPRRPRSPFRPLTDAPAVREAARALFEAVSEEMSGRTLEAKSYERAIREIARLRGRELFLPILTGGTGRGARLRLADGRMLVDFIGGIGVYGFGHGDPDLIETAVAAAASAAVFQGHLMPGPEYRNLSRALVRHAGRRIRHAWLSLSGSMANENALKMILQKHAPADRMLAFEKGWHGRTMGLLELTDRPAHREGLPIRGSALYVPFYDPDLPDSTQRSVVALEAHLARYPGRVAGMLFELVQGEAGFRMAPREFFAALMERCRRAGLAVWVDEVQTFARTGELFAFQTLGLEEFVDVVTVGKTLQGSAALFTQKYNPKPGLVAGTCAGSTVGMAVGARIIARLESEGYLGPEGRVAVLGGRVTRRLEALRKRMPKAVGASTGIGAMHAFVPFDGSPEVVREVLHAAFDEGLLLFSAGDAPAKLRMLLPVNTSDEELEVGFAMLEKALVRVAERRERLC